MDYQKTQVDTLWIGTQEGSEVTSDEMMVCTWNTGSRSVENSFGEKNILLPNFGFPEKSAISVTPLDALRYH